NVDYESMGGESLVAARAALRYQGSRVEINVSGDYTREDSEAGPTVLIAAGATTPPGVSSELFNPFSVNPSVSIGYGGTIIPGDPGLTVPWLVGTDGQPVRLSCIF